MHYKPYRIGIGSFLLLLLSGMALLLPGCKEDHLSIPPQIIFKSDSGYMDHDMSLAVGDRIRVVVSATSSGSNITFFQVSFDNGSRQILLDSGLNHPDLNYSLQIIKSSSQIEKWTFLVMDRDRNKDSAVIFLTKSDISHYGKIITYQGVVLGAQDNTSTGSFLSFTDAEVFDLDAAYMAQSLIDMIYYFGQYEATLSSPNESEAPSIFTGEHGIANWTIKNETRYDTTSLSPQAFEGAADDSLLLEVYEPAAGKRKAKYVQPGMVISFVSPSGKIGLISILEASPGTGGALRFSVKIQE